MVQAQIGVGITTYNRESIKDVVEAVKKHTKGAKIVVVDDCSEQDYVSGLDVIYVRNEVNRGVAYSKNVCLSLLDDCDYIFLLDDDCYPVRSDWTEVYIDAHKRTGQNHFCMTFSRRKNGAANGSDYIGAWNGVELYAKGCGCMLFVTKKVLEVVGGMNENYNRYGFEHLGYSRRIANAGLNDFAFVDIKNSTHYLRSLDYECSIASTLKDTRKAYIDSNRAEYEREKLLSTFMPYKKTDIFVDKLNKMRKYIVLPEAQGLEAVIGGKLVKFTEATDEEIELIMASPFLKKPFEYSPAYLAQLEAQKKTKEDGMGADQAQSTTSILIEAPTDEVVLKEPLPKPRRGRQPRKG